VEARADVPDAIAHGGAPEDADAPAAAGGCHAAGGGATPATLATPTAGGAGGGVGVSGEAPVFAAATLAPSTTLETPTAAAGSAGSAASAGGAAGGGGGGGDDDDDDDDDAPPLIDEDEEEDEDDAAAAAAAANEKLCDLVSQRALLPPSERQTQFLKLHEELCGDSPKHKGVAERVAAIVKKMMDRDERRVAAKPEAANALSAALKALVKNTESNVVGAMRDSGASFRVDADSLFAGVLSWARVSNADACFDPEEIGKIEGEGGKRLPWLPFARLQRDMCSHEKCASYVCFELLVKMCHNAASGATFRDDVSIHAVDLCPALTEQEETFVEKKRADGERTSSWLKAPKGWENLARELAPLTLGVFLEDLDGYPVVVLESKAVIVIARAYYEERGWSFEMWPDEIIAHTGVHPLIARFDGAKHVDGMPAYGVGQVSKDGSVFLVACITAAGDWIYGSNAGLRGGPQFAAAHVTAVSNVFISVGTNGKLVEYDDKERCAFVANGRVNPQTMREAVEKMMSGDYAKDLAAMRSKSAKKAAKTRNEKKDDEGKSIAAKQSAKTRNAKKDDEGKSIAAKESAKTRNAKKDDEGKSIAAKESAETRNAKKREAGQLMYVFEKVGAKNISTFYYQKRVPSIPAGKVTAWGFDSKLAAAVGLNDCLAQLSLSPENEPWFNADPERKQKWKEAWRADA
jgi:hypothetical protein